MASNHEQFPTMIIPKGTEIKINERGQLSIRTPGNLVIQNSGIYGVIQSEQGSIRIEENVTVEAVEILAKDTCLVQGKLTAWRVKADRLHLENSAQAFIMLRESRDLDVAKTSRLVGNFSSEREIYLLLGKFSNQLKGLPSRIEIEEEPEESLTPIPPSPAPSKPSSENLQLALVILKREIEQSTYKPDDLQILKEFVSAIQRQDRKYLKELYETMREDIEEPSRDLLKAWELIKESL